ncbi:hypothetical protein [Acidovorax sp. Root217]|uniref:hypothetical protein n=1 Tax=Acidovorax sp. Root217 TaxID=1736492 RepID=UPI00070FEB2B|nr:hypothetical protein [Acidovorax sp. Root217]KRC30658.1 hypothetical protein ASE31_00270 [Acidovorax sp. Root217]
MTHDEGRIEFAEKLAHFRSEHGLGACWRNSLLLQMDPEINSTCAAVWIDFDTNYWTGYTGRAAFVRGIAWSNMLERLYRQSDALHLLGRGESFSFNAGFGAPGAGKVPA